MLKVVSFYIGSKIIWFNLCLWYIVCRLALCRYIFAGLLFRNHICLFFLLLLVSFIIELVKSRCAACIVLSPVALWRTMLRGELCDAASHNGGQTPSPLRLKVVRPVITSAAPTKTTETDSQKLRGWAGLWLALHERHLSMWGLKEWGNALNLMTRVLSAH